MSDKKFDLVELGVDEMGRVLLSDEALDLIVQDGDIVSAGANSDICNGTSNGSCTNSWSCGQTSNGWCSNTSACHGSGNIACDGGGGKHPN